MKTSIKYIDYYIPEKRISIDDVLKMDPQFHYNLKSEDEINEYKKDLGIKNVALFREEEDLSSIFKKMISQMFERTNINPSDIGYLVCANESLIDEEISVVHFIQKTFKISEAVILPIFQLCTSSIMAIGLSTRLIQSKSNKYMLILTANKFTDIQSRHAGFSIVGDGAALLLIGNTASTINIMDWAYSNDGTNSFDAFSNGITARDVTELQMRVINNGIDFLKNYEIQSRKNLSSYDVIIQPNTNVKVFREIYNDILCFETMKFYLENISEGGHIGDVDIIRNLKDFIDKSTKKYMDILIYSKSMTKKSEDITYHVIKLMVQKE